MRIKTADGIRAASKKTVGQVAERWVNFISGFMLGGRFDRGRTYADKGQVLDIVIEPGAVKAKVQGSRANAYEIEIKFKTLSGGAWENIADSIKSDELLCARLLSAGDGGDFPVEVEEIFEREGASLFPNLENESSMSCSCPDWNIPCKHLVAVFILMGEAFERDPFLIFKLRGIERQKIFALIGVDKKNKNADKKISGKIFKKVSIEELFQLITIPDAPSENAQILDEFGSFPFWKGERTIKEKLAPVYARASEQAQNLSEKWEN